MDCTQAKELMWEKDLPEEFFAHIEACPECKKEYELINKTKTALSSKDDMTGRILVAAMLEKRRRTALKVTRVAAIFLVVFAVGIFGKLAIDSGLKTANDCEAEFSPSLDHKQENSTVGGTDDGFFEKFDSTSNGVQIEAEEEPMAPNDDIPREEAEMPMPEAPECEESTDSVDKSHVLEDSCILINGYKDTHSLPYHTADILVSGEGMPKACDVLTELGAECVESHIEIKGDFYYEVQELLKLAGFDILYASSSESVNKTLVYFEDLIK